MNPNGIGARVCIYAGGKQQMTQHYATRGFMSSTSDRLHFGLGSDTLVDSLLVHWPGLLAQKVYNLRADQTITLDISAATAAVAEVTPSRETIFSSASVPGLKQVSIPPKLALVLE